MIKVEHVISFPEPGGLANLDPIPVDIEIGFSSARIEAQKRGCVLFSFEDDLHKERNAIFIWEDQAAIDSFDQWLEENVGYNQLYQQFSAYIQSKGGTLTKTMVEF